MRKISSLNDEQLLAVTKRNKDILVSAPAGSGKTKILVSRMIGLIIEDQYHIDEFLVLTFTEAAATEMKQRLVLSLEEEMKHADGELLKHLELQKQKLPFAYITNFHGFCNTLLGKYGYLLGLDPKYQIISETRALKDESLEALFLELAKEDTFMTFQSLYFPKGNQQELKDILLSLLQVMSSMNDKDSFIRYCNTIVYDFLKNSNEDLSEWAVFPKLKEQLMEACVIGIDKIYELKQFCMENEITPFYKRPLNREFNPKKSAAVPMDALLNYYQRIIACLRKEDVMFEGSEGIATVSLNKIEKSYTIPWDSLSEKAIEARTKFSSLRTEVNTYYKKKYENLIETDEAERKIIFSKVQEAITYIIGKDGLLDRFNQHYNRKKAKLNVLDFNDLEEYTIKLLQPEYQIASLLHGQLKEIMVDEYQDTNMIQETIISLIARFKEPYVHCFMVGDMKQSIYRFRQADPKIFKTKYDQYGVYDQRSERIELLFNYRSNKIVLDSINYIFNQIMDSHVGGLEYFHDKSAQLNYDYLRKEGAKDTSEKEMVTSKASTRIHKEHRFTTEILLLDKASKPKDEIIDEIEYEAHMIALKIKEMLEMPLMLADYTGERRIEYSDIVVLARATTSFLTFKKVFDYHQIPNHIILSHGFIHSNEITCIISLLKAIDNRYDDVSLLATLRAPFIFSYFTDNEIANIRVENKECSLYEGLINYGSEAILKDKITIFLEAFTTIVNKSQELPFYDFLVYLYEETGYPYFVANQINGEQRYANLELLKTHVIDTNEYLDFSSWVEKLKRWQQHEEYNAPASVTSLNSQKVSFMTIHKSKGLEFPVVIVANHHKKFNLQDGKQKLIVDKNYGVTLKPRVHQDIPINMLNEQLHFKDIVVEYENPYYNILSGQAIKESIDEEMRIYYVALTRASQKLILTGVSDHEDVKRWQQTILSNEENKQETTSSDQIILYRNARKATSYLDWLGIAIMRHPMIVKQLKEESFHILEVDSVFLEDVHTNCEKIEALQYDKRYQLENIEHSKFSLLYYSYTSIDEQKKRSSIEKEESIIFNASKMKQYFSYQYDNKESIEKSIAVTALDEKEKVAQVQYLPNNEKTELSPSEKGTLIHAFMEFLPMDEEIRIMNAIDALYEEGLYTDEERKVLIEYSSKFEEFRKTDLFTKMKEAKIFYKEKPFSYFDQELNQVVHGIFDALCIYDDTVIIIDYKSDRVSRYSEEQELRRKHQTQMDYYKKVMRVLYPNKEVIGYVVYLEINKVIAV